MRPNFAYNAIRALCFGQAVINGVAAAVCAYFGNWLLAAGLAALAVLSLSAPAMIWRTLGAVNRRYK
ncbi:hypothetical protein PLANPX_3425 [Lacipirellula parvula]|uniref:Uncharacterized protein n=1 Tax=Lacipirellula parvula TaxID=2650471 RepID=A0A5K7XHY2_9BACT|nr:hypothetical protein PLANPX_3425 [Lacipirellula parvula]